jgi:hypothetical protein
MNLNLRSFLFCFKEKIQMKLKNLIFKVAASSATVIVPTISSISLFSDKDVHQSKFENKSSMRLFIMAKGK